MKRIIALCILLVMLLSMPSCKRAETDDDVAVVDKQNENTQAPADDTGKEQPSVDNTQKEDTPAVEQNKVETKPSEEQETTVQKGEPCKLTINNTFSDYIVVATLTDAESAKNKTYTPEDFSELDVFLVFENNDYYNIKYYPEYETKTTLFLMLNTPSKQTVLDYIKLLEKDDRVYSAYGNVIEASNTEIQVTFKDNKQYTAQELSVKEINTKNGVTTLTLNEKTTDIVATIKNFLSDSRIETALPVINNKTYEHGWINVSMKYEEALKAAELTETDFSFDISKLFMESLRERLNSDSVPKATSTRYYFQIYLDTPCKQNIALAIDEVKEIIMGCSISVVDELGNYTQDEILVTLTKDESVLNKTYSPSDFSGINVANIYVISPYNEKRGNNVLLKLKLNDSDKTTILEAINVLVKDNRVESADLNYILEVQLD